MEKKKKLRQEESPAGPPNSSRPSPVPQTATCSVSLCLPRFRHRALAPSRRELTDVEASTSHAPRKPRSDPYGFPPSSSRRHLSLPPLLPLLRGQQVHRRSSPPKFRPQPASHTLLPWASASSAFPASHSVAAPPPHPSASSKSARALLLLVTRSSSEPRRRRPSPAGPYRFLPPCTPSLPSLFSKRHRFLMLSSHRSSNPGHGHSCFPVDPADLNPVESGASSSALTTKPPPRSRCPLLAKSPASPARSKPNTLDGLSRAAVPPLHRTRRFASCPAASAPLPSLPTLVLPPLPHPAFSFSQVETMAAAAVLTTPQELPAAGSGRLRPVPLAPRPPPATAVASASHPVLRPSRLASSEATTPSPVPAGPRRGHLAGAPASSCRPRPCLLPRLCFERQNTAPLR
nr:proline-rich protein 36-like [Aegilops tauschii subsp. strangulata]